MVDWWTASIWTKNSIFEYEPLRSQLGSSYLVSKIMFGWYQASIWTADVAFESVHDPRDEKFSKTFHRTWLKNHETSNSSAYFFTSTLIHQPVANSSIIWEETAKLPEDRVVCLTKYCKINVHPINIFLRRIDLIDWEKDVLYVKPRFTLFAIDTKHLY